MHENIAFVQSLYAAFARDDLPFILDRCAPDIAWDSHYDGAQIPWGGRHCGLGDVAGFFRALAEKLDFELFEPQQFFPSGEAVLVRGRTRARHRSGRNAVFDSPWVHIFTIRDECLVAFQEFYDTAAIERALAA